MTRLNSRPNAAPVFTGAVRYRGQRAHAPEPRRDPHQGDHVDKDNDGVLPGGEELMVDPGMRFTVEPNDAVVAAGDSATLTCAAAANHPARFAWRFSPAGVPTVDQTLLNSDQYRKQLPNGSLVIEKMSAALAGQYQCVASVEGVGTIVSRLAAVFLAEVKAVRSGPRWVSVPAGSGALLACPLVAAPRVSLRVLLANVPPRRAARTHRPLPVLLVNVTWYRNDAPLRLEAGRVAVSDSGALELDPAQPPDAARYHCRAQPGAAIGDDVELRVTPESASEFPPRFIAVPQSVTIVEGASVTLDCAAVGNPRPQITWLFNGVEIDLNDLDSRVYRAGGGSLRVLGARTADGGRYTCRAHSSLDSADAAADVTVLWVPRVQVPPSPLGGSVWAGRAGRHAQLPCGSRAAVLWYKDGETVTPNQHDIRVVHSTSLLIQGVLPSDAGMFQCLAATPAGSSQATLRLIVEPPDDGTDRQLINTNDIFDTTGPTTNFSPHMMTSSIKPPSPYSNSTQDIFNSLVSSERFPDQISDFNLEDSDFLGETSPAFTSGPDFEYDYTYDTDLDNISTSSFHAAEGLDLDRLKNANASVVSPPKDLRAVIVKHRFVTLSWDEPELKNEEITGYAIVYKVKGSERERVSLVSGGRRETNVVSLEPNTTYSFQAVALTEHSLSPKTQAVEVRTSEVDLWPGAVTDGRVDALSADRARVAWTRPHDGCELYRLLYTQVETGEEQSIEVRSTSAEVNATLTALQPNAAYVVRVVCVDSGGGGATPQGGVAGTAGGIVSAGGLELRYKAPSAPPSAPPDNVTAKPGATAAIIVHWDPPPARSHNGPLTGYKLRYRPLGAPNAPNAPLGAPARRRADSLTTPADTRRAELSGLDMSTTYQIRVCALNSNGSGPFSEWVGAAPGRRPRAPPAVPPDPPPLTTRAGRDWLSVWWSAAGPAGGDESPLSGWLLGWGLGVPDERSKELPPSQTSYVIRGLESNSEYVISLRGSNALGLGPAGYATVRTKPALGDDDEDLDDEDEEEEEPSRQPDLLPPVGVKVIMLSGTTAVVYWTDPTLPKGQVATDGRRYVVRWSTAGGRPRTFNASDLNCMLDELRPHTRYDFAVKLIKGGRESQWSMLVSNTTLEAPPPLPPRAVRLAPAAGGRGANIDVFWEPPARTNGPLTGYVITYSLSEAGRAAQWAAVSVGAAASRARLERLRPRHGYLVRVQARNSRGLGPPSAPQAITTGMAESSEGALVGPTSAWLWASAGGACAVLLLAAALALSLCCRRPARPPPDTSTYQKSSASAAIKPPDLWIHHDQMELKHIDKSLHSSASKMSAHSAEAVVSSTLTLSRPAVDYEPARPLPASLDRRHHVPAYVDEYMCAESSSERSASSSRRGDCGPMTGAGAGCAATCDRRPHLRHNLPDQGAPLLLAGALSPQASMGSLLPAPCGSSACPLGASCAGVVAGGAPGGGLPGGGLPGGGVPGGGSDIYACAARERGHYVAYEPLGHYTHRDSLSGESGPAGAPLGGSLRRPFLDNSSDHSTPAHSRAGSGRDTSPYKKSASSSPGHLPNRLQLGGAVAHCPSELEPLTPSRSTERLQREMQNLEGLMKDLSAITQQQFHC